MSSIYAHKSPELAAEAKLLLSTLKRRRRLTADKLAGRDKKDVAVFLYCPLTPSDDHGETALLLLRTGKFVNKHQQLRMAATNYAKVLGVASPKRFVFGRMLFVDRKLVFLPAQDRCKGAVPPNEFRKGLKSIAKSFAKAAGLKLAMLGEAQPAETLFGEARAEVGALDGATVEAMAEDLEQEETLFDASLFEGLVPTDQEMDALIEALGVIAKLLASRTSVEEIRSQLTDIYCWEPPLPEEMEAILGSRDPAGECERQRAAVQQRARDEEDDRLTGAIDRQERLIEATMAFDLQALAKVFSDGKVLFDGLNPLDFQSRDGPPRGLVEFLARKGREPKYAVSHKSGLTALFKTCVPLNDTTRYFTMLCEETGFMDILAEQRKACARNLLIQSRTVNERSEGRLKPLTPEQIREPKTDREAFDLIAQFADRIRACEQIVDELQEAHFIEMDRELETRIAALEGSGEERERRIGELRLELQQEKDERSAVWNREARRAMAMIWEGLAHKYRRKDRGGRTRNPRELMDEVKYQAFQKSPREMVQVLRAHESISAKTGTGIHAFVDDIANVYDHQACHDDAVRTFELLVDGERASGETAWGAPGWDACLDALAADLDGTNGRDTMRVYRLRFPEHSMCMVLRSVSDCDFYESVAGRGSSHCVWKTLTEGKEARFTRKKRAVLDGIRGFKGNKSATGGVFNWTASSLGTDKPNPTFEWEAADLAPPEGIEERVQSMLDDHVSICDILIRYPFQSDGRPFTVHDSGGLWRIEDLRTQEEVHVPVLGQRVRMTLRDRQKSVEDIAIVGEVVRVSPLEIQPLIAGPKAHRTPPPPEPDQYHEATSMTDLGFLVKPSIEAMNSTSPVISLMGWEFQHQNGDWYRVTSERWGERYLIEVDIGAPEKVEDGYAITEEPYVQIPLDRPLFGGTQKTAEFRIELSSPQGRGFRIRTKSLGFKEASQGSPALLRIRPTVVLAATPDASELPAIDRVSVSYLAEPTDTTLSGTGRRLSFEKVERSREESTRYYGALRDFVQPDLDTDSAREAVRQLRDLIAELEGRTGTDGFETYEEHLVLDHNEAVWQALLATRPDVAGALEELRAALRAREKELADVKAQGELESRSWDDFKRSMEVSGLQSRFHEAEVAHRQLVHQRDQLLAAIESLGQGDVDAADEALQLDELDEGWAGPLRGILGEEDAIEQLRAALAVVVEQLGEASVTLDKASAALTLAIVSGLVDEVDVDVPSNAEIIARIERNFAYRILATSGAGSNCFIRSIVKGLMNQGIQLTSPELEGDLDEYAPENLGTDAPQGFPEAGTALSENQAVEVVRALLEHQGLRAGTSFINPSDAVGDAVIANIRRLGAGAFRLTIYQWSSREANHEGIASYTLFEGGGAHVRIAFTPTPGHFDALIP